MLLLRNILLIITLVSTVGGGFAAWRWSAVSDKNQDLESRLQGYEVTVDALQKERIILNQVIKDQGVRLEKLAARKREATRRLNEILNSAEVSDWAGSPLPGPVRQFLQHHTGGEDREAATTPRSDSTM